MTHDTSYTSSLIRTGMDRSCQLPGLTAEPAQILD
jgi:hypothetical protein